MHIVRRRLQHRDTEQAAHINGSFMLGRFAGIGVHAHWSAALIAILIGANLSNVVGIDAAIAGTVGFLVSILLHEFGHALDRPPVRRSHRVDPTVGAGRRRPPLA